MVHTCNMNPWKVPEVYRQFWKLMEKSVFGSLGNGNTKLLIWKGVTERLKLTATNNASLPCWIKQDVVPALARTPAQLTEFVSPARSCCSRPPGQSLTTQTILHSTIILVKICNVVPAPLFDWLRDWFRSLIIPMSVSIGFSELTHWYFWLFPISIFCVVINIQLYQHGLAM